MFGATMDSTSISYVPRDQYDLARQAIDECWEIGHIYTRNKELFDWTFARKDIWDKEEYSFAVAEREGRPVGILGAIPFDFNCRGDITKGFWTANWRVLPEARAGNTGLKLFYKFMRPPFDTAIIFGTPLGMADVWRGLGWDVILEMPRHFVVFSQGENDFFRLVQCAHDDWSQDRIAGLLKAFQLERELSGAAEPDLTLPESWNERVWAPLAKKTIGPVRDEAYLRWRYELHPVYVHRFVTVELGRHLGLAVWRRESIALSEKSEATVELGRLVEFLVNDAETAKVLADTVLADMQKSRVLGADFFGFNGRIGQWLNEAGFIAVNQHPDGMFIPSRLQPVDGRNTSIVSAVMSEVPPPQASFDPEGQWLWTKADADQDRPR